MSGRLRGACLLGFWVALAGCAQLKKGHCYGPSDCTGEFQGAACTQGMCVLPPAATGGGGAGGAGGAGGMGGNKDAGIDKGPPSCVVDASICSGNTPFCNADAGTCRGCEADDDCAHLNGGVKPACMMAGDGAGICVQCTKDTQCAINAPVCNLATNSCTACSKDSECTRFPPGICKTNASGDAGAPNGRCVRPDETIYVNKTNLNCSDSTTASAADAGSSDGGVAQPGSFARPFCSMEPIRSALGSRNVVSVTGTVSGPSTWSYNDEARGSLLIAGSGTIAGSASPAFQMQAGDVTIRGITFGTGASVGIEADGGTLHLDRVTVKNFSLGGILLKGASFDIENTTVTGNGPGLTSNGFNWGGILETAVPSSGVKKINQSTVSHNTGTGIVCSDALTGSGIIAVGNSSDPQVSSVCSLLPCTDAGATCGAQP